VELIAVFNLAPLNIVNMIIPRLENIFKDETVVKDEEGKEIKTEKGKDLTLGSKVKI